MWLSDLQQLQSGTQEVIIYQKDSVVLKQSEPIKEPKEKGDQ